MKKTFLISFCIWVMMINGQRFWPISKGERYFRRLERWYMLAKRGDWEKAGKLENKIKAEDTGYYKKNNKSEELKKRLNELTVMEQKNAEEWMETALIFYKLGKKEEVYEAISKAHEIDPIREDINKIYFTYRTSFLQPLRLP